MDIFRPLNPVKLIENMVQVVCRNARPTIVDFDNNFYLLDG